MRRQWLGIWAAIFLAIIFLVAGVSKVFAQSDNFAPLLPSEFLPSFLTQAISIAVPWIEIIIGVLLVLGIAVKFTVSLSGIMIVGFMVTNIMLINLGLAGCPTCFGSLIGGGLSANSALILDGIMAAMVLLIFAYHPSSFKSIKPWCLTSEQLEKRVVNE